MILAAFVLALILMILWGRAQREERDRVHLRKVVNEVPVFESGTTEEYSSLLSDYPTGSKDTLLRDPPIRTSRERRQY